MYEYQEDYDPEYAAENEYRFEAHMTPGFRTLQVGDRVACRDTSQRYRFTEYATFEGCWISCGTEDEDDVKDTCIVDNAQGCVVAQGGPHGEDTLQLLTGQHPAVRVPQPPYIESKGDGMPTMDDTLARQKAGLLPHYVALRRGPKPNNQWYKGDGPGGCVTYNPGDDFYRAEGDYPYSTWYAGTIISTNPLSARLDNGKVSTGLLIGRSGKSPLATPTMYVPDYCESEVWYFPNAPSNFGQRPAGCYDGPGQSAVESMTESSIRAQIPSGQEDGALGAIGRIANFEVDKIVGADNGDRWASAFTDAVICFPMNQRLQFRFQKAGGVAPGGMSINPAPAAGQMLKMSAAIPAGVAAGGSFPIKLADGRTMTLKVPAGMKAGQTLQFMVPAVATPSPQARPAPTTMSAVIPAGVVAGASFSVRLADGRTMTLKVPAGMKSGQTIKFMVPPVAGAGTPKAQTPASK